MRALVTDVCVSEFGWELMEWQGYVRSMARDYKKVVISSTDGFFPIYSDMKPIYIPHRIRGSRDCHRMRPGSIENRDEVLRVRAEIDETALRLRRKGYKIHRIASIPVKKDRAVGMRRPIERQKFIKYGIATCIDDPFDMIIHARNRRERYPSGGANYPLDRWNVVLGELSKRGLTKIAAVGTKDAAFAPAGTVDLRGIPLDNLMNHMAAAKIVIGPSSGPMHLASLCKTPHMVWATSRRQEVIQRRNRDRYLSYWNPFKTPVEIVMHAKGQLTDPKDIINSTLRLVDRVYA
jgi:hypothetical protein